MISGPDRSLFAYALVTAAYWAFMLTDGALRMLVLLYFHINGFDPISLAFLFLLYEFMGMVTNLGAGWIAARFGLNLTLYAGLVLQVGTLALLAVANPTTVGPGVSPARHGAAGSGRGRKRPHQDVGEERGQGFGA